MEVFVKGYEGIYSITSDGEVFSYAKGTKYKRKLVPDKNGYLTVNFNVLGKVSCKKIHRLVAEHFIPNPEKKNQVNHKNGVKTDNTLGNLEWVTNTENIKHMWENNLKPIHRVYRTSKTGEPLIKVTNGYFTVDVKLNKIKYYFGTYKTLPEALVVRDKVMCILQEGVVLEYIPKKVIIYQIQDGIVINKYSSINEAERDTLIPNQSIGKVILGKLPHAGGYFWRREVTPITLNGEEII